MKNLKAILLGVALFALSFVPSEAQNTNPQYGPGPLPCAYVACTVASLTSTGSVSTSANVHLNSNTAAISLGVAQDLLFTYNSAAFLQYGAGDVAGAPVAQTHSYQSAAGISNQAGANTAIDLSAGTGTGIGGNLTINGAPHGTTGTGKNAYAAIFNFNGDTGINGLGSGGGIGWSSTTAATGTIDTLLCRASAGTVEIANGTTCGLSGSMAVLNMNAQNLQMTGSTPTLSGTCTTSTQIGANAAGTFHATCASQTVIITFGINAVHGYYCNATDMTTPGDTLRQTADSGNSCTLTGTTVASDVIAFNAVAF